MVRNAEDSDTQDLVRRSLNVAAAHGVPEKLWIEVFKKFETSDNSPLESRMRRISCHNDSTGNTSQEWLITLWGRAYVGEGSSRVFVGYESLFAGRGKDIVDALANVVALPEGK